MPRGVKKTPQSIDAQLEEIRAKIEAYQSKINSLTAKRKALLESKEKAEMDALYRLVKESGKTPGQLIQELSQH